MTIRRRVNVWDLEPWDDTLVWYARAVRELQGRSLVDPTSFAYQAAVHDRRLASGPGEPSHDEQRRFWRQCQHGTWFFLPWHRIYVAYFEQLVASTIACNGGPRDWALPYWNPSDPRRPETRTLPRAFRDERLPDCTPNPLRIAERDDGVNDGDEVAGEAQVSLGCLCEPEFAARPSGSGTGFGGPAGPAHHGTRRGQLERQPHGGIHSGIGGDMGFPETAALDPIFFLHHANIDRLWVVWRQRDARHVDPTDRAWLDQTFAFHDANGQPVSHAVSEWVDPAKAPLPFEYDDVSDPMAGQCDERLFTWSTTRKASVELASAPGPVRLARGPVRIALRRAPGDATGSTYDGIARAFLDVEEITGRGVSGSYGVFLSYAGSPAETRVGVLPMFGLPPGRDDDHGGHRHPDPHPMHLTYELEVTGAIVRDGMLSIDGLVVTIAPEPRAGRRSDDAGDEPPSIARIRLTLA